MRKTVSVILVMFFTLGLSITSFAQNTPRIDRRERHQQRRIREGVPGIEL